MINKFRIEQRVNVGGKHPGKVVGINKGKIPADEDDEDSVSQDVTFYSVLLDSGTTESVLVEHLSPWSPEPAPVTPGMPFQPPKSYETVTSEPEVDPTSEEEDDDETNEPTEPEGDSDNEVNGPTETDDSGESGDDSDKSETSGSDDADGSTTDEE